MNCGTISIINKNAKQRSHNRRICSFAFGMKLDGVNMIPKNIKKKHVIRAIEEIKTNELPKSRISKKFLLEFNGEYYPPKYVILFH